MSNDEIRAVRCMVDELRAEPTPELPWDAMEAKLFARMDEREERDQRATTERTALSPLARLESHKAPSALARVFGIAAAAAAIALAVGSTWGSGQMPHADAARHHVDVASIASTSEPGAHDIASLHPGDVIEAGDRAVTFAQAGLVRWTLTAGSTVRVSTVGFGHTLQLERGSLRAEVTPRDPSEGMVEAFAVEVDGTRVAVHGTAFSVRRDDTRVIVDVEHGAVAIGPRGNVGTTTGRLLVGPSRGSFSLDGGRSASLLDRDGQEPLVATSESPAPVVSKAGVGSPSTLAPAASTAWTASTASTALLASPGATALPGTIALPASATTSGGVASANGGSSATAPNAGSSSSAKAGVEAATEPRLSAEIVRGRVERCLQREFDAHSSVLASVSSTLSIDVNPDGTVRAARFSPPLNAELTACAGSALGGRFASDAGHIAIPISLQR